MAKSTQQSNLDEWLPIFFAEYQKVGGADVSDLIEWLPVFFDEYQKVRVPKLHQKYAKPATPIDLEKLNNLFHNLEGVMPDARKGAFLCDPWEVACLGRDEVRNSAVLAWLLNPRGSHGIGDNALIALLKALNFPTDTGKYCHVRVESNPTGEIENRVDIEIDSEKFYLVIEVKIKAPEGDKQIERYCDILESLSKKRKIPWALIYLTVKGNKPGTSGIFENRICHVSPNKLPNICPLSWERFAKIYSMSWARLATILQNELTPAFKGKFSAKPASRIMVEQMVMRYISRIKSYKKNKREN